MGEVFSLWSVLMFCSTLKFCGVHVAFPLLGILALPPHKLTLLNNDNIGYNINTIFLCILISIVAIQHKINLLDLIIAKALYIGPKQSLNLECYHTHTNLRLNIATALIFISSIIHQLYRFPMY